jgi:NAD-dependent dihydropyrimidine dehydrogenase PreA subunit
MFDRVVVRRVLRDLRYAFIRGKIVGCQRDECINYRLCNKAPEGALRVLGDEQRGNV